MSKLNIKVSTSRLAVNVLSALFVISANSYAASDTEISLEKIMSDPSWIATTPTSPKWLPDSRHVTFNQDVKSSAVNKQIRLDSLNPNSFKEIGFDEAHKTKLSQTTYSLNGQFAAYVFKGDIFLWDVKTSKVTQVTNTSDYESSPQFVKDNLLGYWEANRFISYNIENKQVNEVFKLSMSDKPEAPKGPADLIASEQHSLINYVANKHKDNIERYESNEALKAQNKFAHKKHFYFGKGNVLSAAKVSPDAEKIIVVVQKKSSWRDDTDVMPNYIAQDGRIEIEKVRRRVADAKPVQQEFWLVDIAKGEKYELAINSLPDFDKDVLADVRAENYAAEGKEYKSESKPRTINLIVDWSWSQSAIQWHKSSKQVAIMLEAWDNKDRWLSTVDLNQHKFVNQHQLHDDAWINYTFNDFGWFNNSEKLYYLSEETGYSHLYTKDIDSKQTKQLTDGEYEVSTPVLTKNDSQFIFRANVNHPGEYHVYKLKSSVNNVMNPTAITDKTGENTFSLSPDETKLLVSHSNLLRPSDLYTYTVKSGESTRLTNTVSEEFKAMPWTAPEIVAVPSTNTDKPIYARVYYPKDYKKGEPRKAVIFNHGAGYLQNSHKGWSGYFREFMFHNMLAQQGYVVMDMDYRASKGYGRDWRTAIYRQMGTPEIEDLSDGVNWLVSNANVDRNRVGTYGGSYGGFMTFMALFTQPDLFQAGAALRPVSDWAHYNDGYTSNILNRPEDDMIAYRKSSPIYFAEGLTKPLLINAPMVDNNVFFVDVVRLVQRFIELEKENFETAIYPVEPHGFVQPSSWLDEYRRIYKLFENNL
ncbi:prolyl oligopeptidase family serine peptidase [Psychrosphaera haliotis]|nr:prolyl oligopeptidase family serine peptidase [Psychrosphaera haliotis]